MAKKKKAKKTKKTKKTKGKRRKPARKHARPTAKKAIENNRLAARAERALEEGLEESFPGSDPLALTDPTRSIKE